MCPIGSNKKLKLLIFAFALFAFVYSFRRKGKINNTQNLTINISVLRFGCRYDLKIRSDWGDFYLLLFCVPGIPASQQLCARYHFVRAPIVQSL